MSHRSWGCPDGLRALLDCSQRSWELFFPHSPSARAHSCWLSLDVLEDVLAWQAWRLGGIWDLDSRARALLLLSQPTEFSLFPVFGPNFQVRLLKVLSGCSQSRALITYCHTSLRAAAQLSDLERALNY